MTDPISGENLKQHLQRLGITQAEFARRLGVSPFSVNRWINNRYQPRSEAIRSAIAHEIHKAYQQLIITREEKDGTSI